MFLVALAAAAASTHSVTGAFGYTLGQAPSARMAACSHFIATNGTEIFNFPGQGSFSKTSVTTQHHTTVSVKGSRDYKGAPIDAAMRSCLADLAPLERMVRRNYPKLVQVPIYSGGNFWFSEQATGKVPTGRSIIGRCSETKVGGDYVMLWLSFDVSTRENVELIHLDKAGAK